MKSLMTLFGILAFSIGVMAQTGATKTQEQQSKKTVETKDISAEKVESTKVRKANMQSIRATKTAEAQKVDMERVNENITKLEDEIEKNKNNPDFNKSAYEQRLKTLKEIKEKHSEK